MKEIKKLSKKELIRLCKFQKGYLKQRTIKDKRLKDAINNNHRRIKHIIKQLEYILEHPFSQSDGYEHESPNFTQLSLPSVESLIPLKKESSEDSPNGNNL